MYRCSIIVAALCDDFKVEILVGDPIKLLDYLHFSYNVTTILRSPFMNIIHKWAAAYYNELPAWRSENATNDRLAIATLLPGLGDGNCLTKRLITLPQSYETLWASLSGHTCSQCKTLPEEPAICLLCGVLVCAGMGS